MLWTSSCLGSYYSASVEAMRPIYLLTVLRSGEEETGTHQEHAEGLAHDAVEEVQTRVPSHHEEVAEEEELPAAVVQQGVVLAAEQGLVWVLGGDRGQRSVRHHLTSSPPTTRQRSYPAISSLGSVRDQDGPLQLGGAQDRPSLAQREDGVPALQGGFGEEACRASWSRSQQHLHQQHY